jgi:predicted AAA+ superfamily ATPase
MYQRFFQPLAQKKSYFLLGPRQTGKSTLLHEVISVDFYFDLLEPSLFVELSARPEALVEMLSGLQKKDSQSKSCQYVVIDEIQKLPSLLDTAAHQLPQHILILVVQRQYQYHPQITFTK